MNAVAFTTAITLHRIAPQTHVRTVLPRQTHTKISAALPATPPQSRVNPARTAVVTGANGGIGIETCKGLARMLPNLDHLILCCRTVDKARPLADALRRPYDKPHALRVDIVDVDLSNSDSIVACVNKVRSELAGNPLDLLVCNAGVMACPLAYAKAVPTAAGEGEGRRLADDNRHVVNVELQYFVNHLSHALLTDRLLPDIRASSCGRVVFVSSLAVAMASGRATAPLVAEKTDAAVTAQNYGRWPAYGDSKLAMSLFARALADEEAGRIETVSLYPGIVQTELGRHLVPAWMGKLNSSSGPTFLNIALRRLFGFLLPEEGAALTLEVALAERGSLQNGCMYVKTGGELASDSIIPLLKNRREYQKLYADTKAFIDEL